MNESARSQDVLKKLLKKAPSETQAKSAESTGATEKLISNFLNPPKKEKSIILKKPGRPAKADHLKAKNFTLCLDPKYLKFLDEMKVPSKKLHGRGRKIRFIIDQFMELHRRQRGQLEVLVEALNHVEKGLSTHSSQVKKGQKLELTPREKSEISKQVGQVQTLIKLLGFRPRELHKLLSKEKWAIMAFCLDWAQKHGLKS